MRIKNISTFFLASILMVSFSVNEQSAQWKGKIEYEDGVKVIVNPDVPLYAEIELDLEEDLVIGNEEDENYLFNMVISINVDKDGNIYVVDLKETHIQVYDKFGKYIKTLGQRGQGPGEFSNLMYLHIDSEGDLYVQEMYRVHQFDPKGVVKRSMPIGNPSGYQLTLLAILGGEKILARLHKTTERGTESKIALIDKSGEEIITIVEYPPYELEPRLDGRVIPLWNPYHYMPLVSSYIRGLGLYAFSKEYEVVIVNSSGEKIFIVRKAEPPSSITKKERDLLVDSNYESLRDHPAIKNKYQLSRADIEKITKLPNHKPYFNFISTDLDGNIYAIKLRGPRMGNYGVFIDFFNSEGKYLHRFILENKFPAVFRGDCIYTIEQEIETGYQRIKRYKIKNWDQIKVGI